MSFTTDAKLSARALESVFTITAVSTFLVPAALQGLGVAIP